TIAGQRVDAAQALDHVSEIQEAAGRLPEAADTLRRALELEEAPERARRQRGLLRDIRLSAGDRAAEQLLARALRLRDEPAEAVEPVRASYGSTPFQPGMAAASASPVGAAQADLGDGPKPAQLDLDDRIVTIGPANAATKAAAEADWPAADLARTIAAPEPVVADAEPSEPVPVAVGVMEGAFDTAALAGPVGESEHQPTGDELLAAAEAADEAGDNTALRSLLLWTARAYAREGRFEAGLDATHRILQSAPGDVDAHLVLVELYVARDWNALAAEKLVLLGRLAELNGDAETRQRLCAVASRAFPNNERLEALCS
ncbi:MAG: hypothetical protein ACHQ01_10335, partial [Candidatus Limnocylindrales bacterium]